MDSGPDCENCDIKSNLAEILGSSEDIIYKYNLQQDRYEFISDSAQDFMGTDMSDLKKIDVSFLKDLLHPDDREAFCKFCDDLAAGRVKDDTALLEYRTKNLKTGRYIWQSDRINIIRNGRDKPVSIFGIVRKIDEQKKLQHKLSNVVQQYKNLYEQVEIALYKTRFSDGALIECNNAFAKMFGYENKQQCLNQYQPQKHYVDISKCKELMEMVAGAKQVDNFVLQIATRNKENIWVRASARTDADKKYIEGAVWNITAEKILTDSEKMILEQILHGLSNKQIAEELHRSVRTIEDHRAHIMRKLHAGNLVELTKKALNMGLDGEL